MDGREGNGTVRKRGKEKGQNGKEWWERTVKGGKQYGKERECKGIERR